MRRTKILVIAAIAATVTGVCLLVVCTLSSGVAVIGDADLADGSHVYIVNTDGTGFMRLDDVDNGALIGDEFMPISKAINGSKVAFGQTPELFGNTDVYTFDWDSTSLTKVASETNTYYDFSPDFSKIANFDKTFESLYIMNGDGSGRTRIEGGYYKVDTGYSQAIWSPDNSKIVYHWKEIKRIYIVDVRSYTRTEILDYFEVSPQSHYYVVLSQVSWSPDSTKLYYIGDSDLHVMNADGTGIENIAEDIASYYLSPDGSRIIYMANSRYHVMNADGSGKTYLVDSVDYPQLKWSPDGSKIAYMIKIEDTNWYDLYAMNADGSDRTRLTRYEEHGVIRYEWAPDSDSIFYIRAGNRDSNAMSDIYVTSTDRTYFAKLTNHWDDAEHYVEQFYLSPDGKKLAYQVRANMQLELGEEVMLPKVDIYVMNVDGTENRKLTDCSAVIKPIVWSPDGSKLLFVADKQIEEPEE